MLGSKSPSTETVAETDNAARGLRDSAIVTGLQNPWLLVLLVLAGAVPLLLPSIPPLIDLGGHLGRFAIQLDAGDSVALRQWYSFTWDIIPNLGTDLLVQVLAPLMGLEPALKLIVICIVVIQIAGYILLARVAHGHVPPTALFALPLAYSVPFQHGFLNFTLSMALATCALALWMYLGISNRAILRWLLFVPIASLLWICHLVGWVVFCGLAGADELMRRHVEVRNLLRSALQSVLPLSCLLAPWLIRLVWPSAPSGHGINAQFFDLALKLYYVLHAMNDRWMAWDLASLIVILGLIYWTWRSGSFLLHAGLALGAAITLAAFLLMPGTIMGSTYADMRLVPTFLAIGLISVRPREGSARNLLTALAIAGMLFAGARFAGNGISLALSEQEISRDLAALDAVPRNSNLISLTVLPCNNSNAWALERRSHLAGFAVARRHAFANDQWTIPGGQLLQVHNPDAKPFDRDPSQFARETACESAPSVEQTVARVPPAMDYLWIVGSRRLHPLDGWDEVKRSGTAVIYRRSPSSPASSPANSGPVQRPG